MQRRQSGLFVLFSLIVLSLLFITPQAQSQNLVQRTGPRTMQGARPLGMGNAFIAVKGTDENALFYNPAAINDYEKKFHFQFLLPTVEFSYKSINFFANDIPNLADDIDAASGDSAKINAFNNFAQSNTGRYEEVGIRGNVAMMMHKYITAAIFYDTQGVIALTNPASSTIDVEVVTDAGIMIGSAYSFFDDHLQVGGAVKFIERHFVDETITQRDVVTNADFGDIFDFKKFGFGIGADVGLKGTLPINGKVWDKLKPTFALTLQDIGDTRFFSGDDDGRRQETLSVGSAIQPKVGPFETVFALDMRDLDHRGDFLTKFHFGTEWTWPEISKILRSASLRLGCDQAYFTAGLGLDFKYFKLNASTYGREIANSTIQKQSRMFAFQLAAGF